MQLSKMMEAEEAKKERDEEFEELQETSAELESEIAVLKDELLDAQSFTASLQQVLQASRYSNPNTPCLSFPVQPHIWPWNLGVSVMIIIARS